ncbi:hypothetical protein AB0O08_15910 [Streptomyces anulatus]|uniref:hypothetical protein n=1 Tax=Streptomyces anulatus TaxID=1892 RepID=UPI0034437F6F
MTTQPPRIALADLTSDALDALYDRAEAAEREVTDMATAAAQLTRLVGARADRAEARVRELEADNARLTAGQCTDSRAMCEQHHLPPVAGCPYPRCRAASATGRAATA